MKLLEIASAAALESGASDWRLLSRAGEPEPESERPEPHDLVGVGSGAEALLFFLQKPKHFKKLEWSRNRSWHKLVRLQQFLKIL